MKTHNVIDTNEPCAAKVISQECDDVLVPIQAHRFGIHGRKTPILTFREYRIRRGSAGNVRYKELPIPPDIITVGMQSERNIEIKRLTAFTCLIRKPSKLLLNDPLGVEMILFRTLVVVGSAELRVPQRGGPTGPPFPLAISHGAKFGITLEVLVFLDELFESVKALRTGLGKELKRKLFENAPLVCHDAAVVDKLRSARGLARLSARKFGNPFDIDVKLIPEKSRSRRVGTWLKRLV